MKTFIRDTITLLLNTGKDLSTYTDHMIKYRNPDGTTGYWNASICPLDSNCIQTIVNEELLVPGKWIVQAFTTDGASRYHGEFAEFLVLAPLADD